MKNYGFVNEVHPDEDLEDAAQNLGEHLIQKSPLALERMKKIADTTLDKSRDDALNEELLVQRIHLRSYDIQEGLSAFIEKRQPEFKGF